MYNCLWPHGLQHTSLPCPLLFPSICSNSCPLSLMLFNHLILYHSLLLLPSIFPSIRVFSNESALIIRWPKYWSFSFSISPSKEHSGVISFRIDWFDLLAIQGTFKSLPQHHSSKAPILHCSAFFISQLSHPYLTTGKTIALTIWMFVGKITFLLSNILSMFVILEKCIFCLQCNTVSSFSTKKQASFNFMTVVIVHSDFGAPYLLETEASLWGHLEPQISSETIHIMKIKNWIKNITGCKKDKQL